MLQRILLCTSSLFRVCPVSVLGAEERCALFTLGLVLVEELVEAVEVGLGGAVDVVPPVADEVLLVEDGAVGAEEAVGGAVGLAHVEHLMIERSMKLKKYVRISNKNMFPTMLLMRVEFATSCQFTVCKNEHSRFVPKSIFDICCSRHHHSLFAAAYTHTNRGR